MKSKAQNPTPTAHDYEQLQFWLWACMRNVWTYFERSAAQEESFRESMRMLADMSRYRRPRPPPDRTSEETQLAAYHLLCSIGKLVRVLERSRKLFPEIEPSVASAQHLFTEGKVLRDMVEHEDAYRDPKTRTHRPREEFVRSDGNTSADATSTIINDSGHWLGGRLNVERLALEVCGIMEIAARIPEPPLPGSE